MSVEVGDWVTVVACHHGQLLRRPVTHVDKHYPQRAFAITAPADVHCTRSANSGLWYYAEDEGVLWMRDDDAASRVALVSAASLALDELPT